MSHIITPSTGISDGSNLIVRLYDAVKAVKIHKKRLSGLANQCDSLLSTVREHSPQLVGTTAAPQADEIEGAIERILNQVLEWTRYSDRVAFIRRNEIQLGIDECYRELTACSDRFTVAMNILATSDSRVREEVRQRDNQRLYDMMARILEEVRKNSHREVQPLVESLTLQQELVVGINGQQPSLQLVAPPRPKDLSEKVSIVSQQADIEGCLMNFYLGEWNSDGEQARHTWSSEGPHFKEWVEAWVGLQHRNLLSLLGHVRIGDIIYSVSPWMGKGNVREYLRINPDADRLRLLSEVASGMEFLHENEIVHGDLCGKNVLINGDGKAFVCGFNLSEYLSPSSDMSRARWFAPERITSTGITSPTEKGDMWSFGSLSVEVFTGENPYSSHADFYVPVLLTQGIPPADHGSTPGDISPKMWELMESCWQIKPAERPSMSEVLLAIRGMLPPRDRQQSTFAVGNLDPLSVPAPLPTTIERRPIDASDSLSPPAPLPPRIINEALQLTEEPSLIVPPSPSRPIGPPPDRKINPRISNASSLASTSPRLPTLPEDDDHSPDPRILTAQLSIPPQSLSLRNKSSQSKPPSLATLQLDPRRQMSDSSQSTSSTSESVTHAGRPPRRWPFPITRSRTSPAGVAGSQVRPGSSGSSESITHSELPSKPPTPSKSGTTWLEVSSVMVPQPSRSASSLILQPQNRQWIPVNPEVLDFMQTAANDTECLLRPAKDGSVSSGNLEGLVSRVITGTADSSRDDRFRAAFLTIYQLFATSERVFGILKRRFESTGLDPAHVGSRYLILLFIESWLKKGFEDVNLSCSSKIKEFAGVISDSESERMEKKAAEIARLVDDPEYVRLRKPESAPRLRREPAPRPPGVTPSDVAAALTVVEGTRFKSITYWDYVNFTRGQFDTRRIEVFNTVHDLVTAWVKKTILEPDYLDERMKAYEEWIHTAQTCRNLNNFSSASAIVVALTSQTIRGLVLTCESKAVRVLQTLCRDLAIGTYQTMLDQVGTTDLIPWLDPHLSSLNVTFAHPNPIVAVDEHPLIDFWQCRELADQIDSLIRFSPPRCPGTRQDVLAFVEYSLKSITSDSASRAAADARSAKLAGEERLMLEHRARMRSLGIPWSPQRRK
ncbi:ras guanine nucleotide exchange factor domain-containing protein [Lactifluus subvellereus]|nr:ras guanine nucleotide exchange factor domain-containing protein [Lactifluus subvellereus]